VQCPKVDTPNLFTKNALAPCLPTAPAVMTALGCIMPVPRRRQLVQALPVVAVREPHDKQLTRDSQQAGIFSELVHSGGVLVRPVPGDRREGVKNASYISHV